MRGDCYWITDVLLCRICFGTKVKCLLNGLTIFLISTGIRASEAPVGFGHLLEGFLSLSAPSTRVQEHMHSDLHILRLQSSLLFKHIRKPMCIYSKHSKEETHLLDTGRKWTHDVID